MLVVNHHLLVPTLGEVAYHGRQVARVDRKLAAALYPGAGDANRNLVQVFAGSVLNITGQAVEVIAITMAVYLFLSLVTSLLMNLYGRTVGIVER